MALLTDKQFAGLGVLGAIGAVGLWYAGRKVGAVAEEALDTAVESVNPLNESNIFAESMNGAYGYLTGDPNWKLGSVIYDGVDSVYGLFGASDADKRKEAEAKYRAQYQRNAEQQFADSMNDLSSVF